MPYTITFYKDDLEVDSLLWGGSRESAIEHARNHYELQSEQRGATSVIVRDDGGHLVIQHPQSKSEHHDA